MPAGKKFPNDGASLAYEELLIAEGSDWCWWYGPEHETANRVEFDELYRDHLANVYAALNLTAPEVLSRPIIQVHEDATIVQPTARIRPKIDGLISSYFEWMGAGQYQVSRRGGSMHGKRFVFSYILFGSDGDKLFLRVDFGAGTEDILKWGEVRCTLRYDGVEQQATLRLSMPKDPVRLDPSGEPVEWAANTILEIAIPLRTSAPIEVSLSAWKDGLPVDAVPQQGWLTIAPEATWGE